MVVSLYPVDPIPRMVTPSSSAPATAVLLRLHAVSPAGVTEAPPARFEWLLEGRAQDVALVLCDASYREIARVDGIVGTVYRPTGAVATALAAGGTFHWFVEAGASAARVRSALETVEIR